MQSDIIYTYYPLLASLLAMVMSQCVKLITMLIRRQPFKWSSFTRPGGMPSSHSALITAITLSVGLTDGFDTTAFFICVALSFVVIYDARGIRHTVGNHARILNQTLLKDGPKHLNEQTGHTLPEIFVGGALGGIIAWGMYHLLNF
jgi:acid phosphatase family membrane protein YuiD